MERPSTGRILRYRGKRGLHAIRAAIVTADIETLDPAGVHLGAVPPLDSARHVHLWVFTPGEQGGFHEYNVPQGDEPGCWYWPPRA
ncbi:hypothetical protein [Nonomuraea endophytica]|uniref:hypothetical protein n=1 Tax=Nonomuraea endophytica TaxID=714136 RepID=UPI0037C6831E